MIRRPPRTTRTYKRFPYPTLFRSLAQPLDMGDAASRDLLTDLARWPDVVEAAGEPLEPHQVPTYLLELAQAFQTYYHDHQLLVDDAHPTDKRLALARAVRKVRAHGLDLDGLHAPVKMKEDERHGQSQ